MRNRLGLVAVLALLSAAGAPVQAAPAACKVTWTSARHLEFGDQKLSTTVYQGRYEGPATAEFTLMDDDGFLTLAILASQWQSDGRAQANLTAPVTLRKAELELAMRAARIGTAYQASLLRGDQTGLDQEPAEYEARQEFFRVLAADLRGLIARAGPGGVIVPAGFIRDRFGTTLERLAPGSPRRIHTYYIDPAKPDEAHPFCDPKAPNALVGQILCSRNFVTGAQRTGSACPGGVSFNDLAAIPLTLPEPAAP